MILYFCFLKNIQFLFVWNQTKRLSNGSRQYKTTYLKDRYWFQTLKQNYKGRSGFSVCYCSDNNWDTVTGIQCI